jgi:hypothetical protein
MGEATVCFAKENSETKKDLKRDRLCFEQDNLDEEELYSSNKRQTKEPSNDDMKSEISNPVPSPVVDNASSFRDITSNPAKSSSGDRVGSCSGSYETITDEKHSEYCSSLANSDAVPSSFEREIPKHLSTTGITKITFKLSKRNEDFCDLPMIQEHTWEGYPSNVASSTLGVKMLKKIDSTNFLSNVKKLLGTGILDGARVKYLSTSAARELQGIIHSGGYLCGCTACDFSKVLGAYEFERHAGGKTKHPNNHIYLENGRPVYNVIQELRIAPPDVLEEVIRKVAGSALSEEGFQAWKGSFQQDKNMTEDDSNHIMDHSFQSLVRYFDLLLVLLLDLKSPKICN